MSLAELMNVKVVSATKTQESIKDISETVYVITSRQIRDRGYFTLEEALSDLPGIQFRNVNGFNSYIFMRGAPNQNNLVLLMIDGVQINELNSGGFYGGGQFILSDIEQIEVVFGPASSLYGTNAVSGIINIITKKPDRREGHVEVLGGSFHTGMAGFNIKNHNKEKDFGYSISGQYKTTEKADLKGENGDNNWTDEMENFENDISLAGRFGIKQFSAGFDYQNKKSSRTTNSRSVNDIYLDKNTLWDIMFLNAFIKYTYSKQEKWSINSTAYYRNSTVNRNTISHIIKATDTTAGSQVGYYRPNHLVGLENHVTFKPYRKLKLTGGIIAEAESLADGYSISVSGSENELPVFPLKPGFLSNQLLSYFVHVNWKVAGSISFDGGIRHDFSSYYGQVFIPRCGLVYNKDNLILKTSYNQAYRSPRPWDYNYGTGNNDLSPERMRSLEFAADYLVCRNFNLGVSVYVNSISDIFTKEVSETGERWINNDALNTNGFEIHANLLAGNFDIYANYTYNNSFNQNEIFAPEISRHTANSGITYSVREKLVLNLRLSYTGERTNPFIIPSTGNYLIDDALIFHGCISYTLLRDLVLQMKINNLFNTEYYHTSNLIEGRYRQPQRCIILSVAYNFHIR